VHHPPPPAAGPFGTAWEPGPSSGPRPECARAVGLGNCVPASARAGARSKHRSQARSCWRCRPRSDHRPSAPHRLWKIINRHPTNKSWMDASGRRDKSAILKWSNCSLSAASGSAAQAEGPEAGPGRQAHPDGAPCATARRGGCAQHPSAAS
jgi:hypothetical protein